MLCELDQVLPLKGPECPGKGSVFVSAQAVFRFPILAPTSRLSTAKGSAWSKSCGAVSGGRDA